MRGGVGGHLLVLSLRDSQMWVVTAQIERGWLKELQSAPQKRVSTEMVVTARGGWDLATEQGQARFWVELRNELEKFVGKARGDGL